jgi:hypothetical protein
VEEIIEYWNCWPSKEGQNDKGTDRLSDETWIDNRRNDRVQKIDGDIIF